MIRKVKNISLIAFSILFVFSMVFAGVIGYRGYVFADNETAEVYYVGADRETKGYWYYVGDNENYTSFSFEKTNEEGWLVDRDENLRITGQTLGGYGNYWSCRDSEEITGVPFDPSLRKYGREGLVGVYTKLQYGMFDDNGDHRLSSGDGQPCKDVSLLSDFTESSLINYVEYPEWVEKDKITCETNYLDYWQHSEDLIHGGHVRDKDLLSPDPYRWNRKVGQPAALKNGTRFVLPINDDQYHSVSFYVNNNGTKEEASLSSVLTISDANGKILYELEDHSAAAGVYYKFIVKGPINVTLTGDTEMSLTGIFFDPVESTDGLQKTNLKTELTDSKTVKLSWDSEIASYTVVLKKETSETQYSYLTTVASGENSYIDTTNNTSKEYSYIILPAIKRAKPAIAADNYTAFDCLYDYAGFFTQATQKTANYRLANIQFSSEYYEGYIDEEVIIQATLKKNVVIQGDTVSGGTNYAHREVYVSLYSESIFGMLEGVEINVIGTDLGKVVTDENGIIIFSYIPRYVGEYKLIFSTLDEDGETEETSYAGGEWETSLYVLAAEDENRIPVAFDISQAVKPGETVSITGANFNNNDHLKVAYALQKGGVNSRTYTSAVQDGEEISYLDRDELDNIANDGSSIMFELPETASAGVYDIWILNEFGWSDSITLNNPIPVYTSQEASYAGLPIEIVGRNFDPTEYGMSGDFSDYAKNIRVRLTQIGDLNGNKVDSPETVTIGIKDDIRYYAKRDTNGNGISYANEAYVWGDTAHSGYSITGEDIYWSNAYKIAFDTPDVAEGTYRIEVAVDGVTFYELQPQYVNETLQQFKIYTRKAQNYDTNIFGSEERIGNDPLGLEVYWAQDIKWNNVVTMSSQYYSDQKQFVPSDTYESEIDLAIATMEHMRAQLKLLENSGGGVLYFPQGYYFIHGGGTPDGRVDELGRRRGAGITIPENCVIVGAGYDKTFFELVYDDTYAATIFDGRASNIGMARLTIEDYKMEQQGNRSDMLIYFCDPMNLESLDYNKYTIQNNFLADVNILQYKRLPYDFNGDKYEIDKYPEPDGYRRLIRLAALKNTVVQNVITIPSDVVVNTGHYSKYTCVESHTDWGNCVLGKKYVMCENILNDGGKNGHGLNIRSYSYVANNYITRQGRVGVGEGETLLCEPAGIACSNYGDVLGATERTITIKPVKGTMLNESSQLTCNLFTLWIIGGKGAGQWRYVSQTSVAGKDGVNTGLTYQLLSGEDDWDVLPDNTSKYTLFNANVCNTMYKNICTDSGGALLVAYCGVIDSVAIDNVCINTGGITAEAHAIASEQLPSWNVRIENNYVYGVSHGIEEGIEDQLSSFYTDLDFRSGIRVGIAQNAAYGDKILSNITIKNNTVEHVNKLTVYGKEVGFAGVIYVGQDGETVINNITIEGNQISDTNNYGIYIGSDSANCVVRNNQIFDYTAPAPTDISSSNTKIEGQVEFDLNNTGDGTITGFYQEGDKLPILFNEEKLVFVGWARDKNVTDESDIMTVASGVDETLYPIYGYKVTFSDNYEGAASKDYAVIKDSLFNRTVNPSYRSGYKFDGWYYDENCLYAFDNAMPIDGNITLYAKWTKNDGGTSAPGDQISPVLSPDKVNVNFVVSICLIVVAVIELSVFTAVILIKRKR